MIKIRDLLNHMAHSKVVSTVKPNLGRSRLYIGNKVSTEAFQAFIMGYRAAAPQCEIDIWETFGRWAKEKLGVNGCYSMSIISVVSIMKYGHGQRGVAKLLELWREYEATLGNAGACNPERQEDQKENASAVGCTGQ
jgi:hypothetical protein